MLEISWLLLFNDYDEEKGHSKQNWVSRRIMFEVFCNDLVTFFGGLRAEQIFPISAFLFSSLVFSFFAISHNDCSLAPSPPSFVLSFLRSVGKDWTKDVVSFSLFPSLFSSTRRSSVAEIVRRTSRIPFSWYSWYDELALVAVRRALLSALFLPASSVHSEYPVSLTLWKALSLQNSICLLKDHRLRTPIFYFQYIFPVDSFFCISSLFFPSVCLLFCVVPAWESKMATTCQSVRHTSRNCNSKNRKSQIIPSFPLSRPRLAGSFWMEPLWRHHRRTVPPSTQPVLCWWLKNPKK